MNSASTARLSASSRVQRGICFLSVLVPAIVVSGQTNTSINRPRIRGIECVRIYVSDLARAKEFYSKLYGVRLWGGACSDDSGKCFTVGWFRGQKIELEERGNRETKNLLASITFGTDDIKRMRSYLVSRGVDATEITRDTYGKSVLASHFDIHDPEGNRVRFNQRFLYAVDDTGPGDPFIVQIIHAGFVAHDPATMDRFYKDILGFRPYWHGGMKDDKDDWVDMQVPDGTDWIEYMLNVPANADHHTLGVMNHIALGVPDIRAAREQLIKNGWTGTEQPKIGRDGKWQLNLYDPDDTRVEFMEFTPTQKPCCSEYTGPHPGQKP
jgi:catechol 2,3-dioxygenase-like lactoylglutathione lyase family enzyme